MEVVKNFKFKMKIEFEEYEGKFGKFKIKDEFENDKLTEEFHVLD